MVSFHILSFCKLFFWLFIELESINGQLQDADCKEIFLKLNNYFCDLDAR